jgi:signal transduction histidine kinase/CheY-like chemotaxis protein
LSKTYATILIVILALIGLSTFTSSLDMEKEVSAIVGDAIPIASTTHNLLIDLINQETGLRGYEVTRDQAYLDSYHEGKAQLDKDLAILRQFEGKYPNLYQLVELEALPIIKKLQEHYDRQISNVNALKMNEVLSNIDTGKQLMDQYRHIHSQILLEVQRIIDEAHNTTVETGQRSRGITLVGSLVALLIGILSVIFFNRAKKAQSLLHKSEETYRHMAESLEAQNEEIIAQQEQQEITLTQLSQREQELEIINSYQEKLTGVVELKEFLKHSIPALLDSLKLDAALVVMEVAANEGNEDKQYEVIYSCGYPKNYTSKLEKDLFGLPKRVFEENKSFVRGREVTSQEQGLHEGLSTALDQYFPLRDDTQKVIGFILLTHYQASAFEERDHLLARGLIRQFDLAFNAQIVNEERRKQTIYMKDLNNQLQLEKQFIENQRDLIESILESANEGMMMCDANGTLLFSNQRMSRYFDLHLEVGHNWMSISKEIADHTPAFSTIAASVEALLTGSLGQFSQRFSFVSGDQQEHAELYATTVGDGTEQKGFLFVFRDRTEEERVDELKNEFVSIVSHELRTPLASVLGFIEILLHRELTPDKQKKYMDTIYKEAQRLSNLINDFLDLQRMESGKQMYHFAPVNLAPIVQEVIDQWQGKQNHKINLYQNQPEVWVKADIDRIRQVIHNLLSNAIKYSPSADHIDMRLEKQGDRVLLSIQDYGLGIPEDARDHLFSKFFRVDNTDRRQIGGTGLGLVIVKEIVEAHSGHISYFSTMGEGTTFTMELSAFELAHFDGSIVILEDDINLAKLIQVALQKLKYPCTLIQSAEEAILTLQRSQGAGPILFIVDIHLEGSKNGWDFLAELYRHPVHFRTPVIVSTALDPPLDYHEKDIERYLKKPFTMEQLVQVAQHLIDNKQSSSYFFPAQNADFISNNLERNGIKINGIKVGQDLIEVHIKEQPSE